MRLLFVSVALLSLTACGTPSIEGDPIPFPTARRTQSTSDDLIEDDDDDAEEETTTTPKTPKTPKGACAGEGTARACFACCTEEAPANALDVHTAALEACLCTEACATECASTLCAGTKANAACTACMNAASACDDKAFAACDADASCKAVLTCADESGCTAKK